MNQKLYHMKTYSVLILFLYFLMYTNLMAQNTDQNQELEIRAMAGQMLLVGFRGFEATDDMTIVEDITERSLGGVILFDYDVPNREARRNIESPQQVQSLITDLQSLTDIPLFVAVDQEGGRVNRLKERYGFPIMPSAEDMGQADSSYTYSISKKWAELLANTGFNLNFAPVVDVNTNPENPIIGALGRSFSGDEHEVSAHAEAFINGHDAHNVLTAIKHFPGHGSAWNDSHLGMADVTNTWMELELTPYRQLISNGKARMIMTAHIFNKHLDSEHPATLSHAVLTDKLRGDFGYEGIIISDDMQMKAITEFYGFEEAIVKSINAGVDILIFANNSVYEEDVTERAVEIITRNVQDGNIPIERIRKAYQRIMQVKSGL